MDPRNWSREYWKVAAATVATASVLLYAIKTSNNATRRQKDNIPSPPGWLPFFGHILSIKTELPAYTFKQWHVDHGPVLRANLGAQEWVMVSDPDILHELLVQNGAASSGRPFVNYSSRHYALNKKGIVLSDGNKKWKSLRSAALTILSPKMVNEYSNVHLSEADTLVDDLIKMGGGAQGIYPEKLLKKTSLNYVLDTCFGIRVSSEEDPLFKKINTFIDEGLVLGAPVNDLGAIFPALSFVDKLLRRDNMFATFIKEKRDPLFHSLIKQAASGDRDCLIKRLVDNKEEYGLDDDDILVAACDIVTGGTDTTAVTLAWIIAILVNHPDASKRISEEVDNFISEHKRYPVFSDRSQFPFLNAVQKESMRYRSIGHFVFFHVLDKDIQTHGYLFPKGSWIYPSTYTIHTNSDIYPDADKFVPERFLQDNKTMAAAANAKPGERDHYTFGFGRRVCPGIHLAEVEMFNVLVRIFARCTLEPALDDQGKPMLPDLDAARDGGITVLPPEYQVRFVPRADALI